MPYRDLRAFLERLEEEGELVRVKEEVDWNLEIGAILRRACDLGDRAPAPLFERIKDYPGQRLTANLLSTFPRYALALGMKKDAHPLSLVKEYKERLKRPRKPHLVRGGPCQEVVEQGEEVDLLRFPVPKWSPLDGGRYFGTAGCNITKDPDTGWVNVGVYRNMVHDEKHLGIFLGRVKHAMLMYEKYRAKGEAMPIAISIGQDPINVIAGYHNAEAGECEWDVAGALRGEGVELVKCQTIDLEVPSTAEIIVEGEMLPEEVKEEGPYGEYTGYYGGERRGRPVIRAKAVTHREDPIFTGTLLGKPITETQVMAAIGHSAKLEEVLLDQLKLDVKAVYSHPWTAGHAVFVSAKRSPGLAKRIAHAIWGSRIGYRKDYVVVVGEDVDITDLGQVVWAICTRCKPDRDIFISCNEPASHLLPSLTPEERRRGIGSHALLEADFPGEWPEEWAAKVCDWDHYPEEVKKRVLERWRSYGLEG